MANGLHSNSSMYNARIHTLNWFVASSQWQIRLWIIRKAFKKVCCDCDCCRSLADAKTGKLENTVVLSNWAHYDVEHKPNEWQTDGERGNRVASEKHEPKQFCFGSSDKPKWFRVIAIAAATSSFLTFNIAKDGSIQPSKRGAREEKQQQRQQQHGPANSFWIWFWNLHRKSLTSDHLHQPQLRCRRHTFVLDFMVRCRHTRPKTIFHYCIRASVSRAYLFLYKSASVCTRLFWLCPSSLWHMHRCSMHDTSTRGTFSSFNVDRANSLYNVH